MPPLKILILTVVLLFHLFRSSSQEIIGYIHPENGIDSINCSSLDNPCKTITYFAETFPNDGNDDIRIILLADWMDRFNCLSFNNRNVTKIHMMGARSTLPFLKFECDPVVNIEILKLSNLEVKFSTIKWKTIEIVDSTIVGIDITRHVDAFILDNIQWTKRFWVANAISFKISNSYFSESRLDLQDFSNHGGVYEITNSTFSYTLLKFNNDQNQRNILINGSNFIESTAIFGGRGHLIVDNCKFQKNYPKLSKTEINPAIFVQSIDLFKVSISQSTFEKCNMGAIYLEGIGVSGEITNSNFTDNSNINGGSAIFLKSIYSMSIHGSIFENNRHIGNSSKADQEGGGAIYQHQSLLSTSFCKFIGNEAISGGAILSLYAYRYKSTFDQFLNNSAIFGGAYSAIDLTYLTTVAIYSSVFQYNRARKYGGAIFTLRTMFTLAQQSLISYNRADITGGGIYTLGTKGYALSRSDMYSNNYVYTKAHGYIISDCSAFPELLAVVIPEKNFLSYNNHTGPNTTYAAFGENIFLNIKLFDNNTGQVNPVNIITDFEIRVESVNRLIAFDVLETTSFGVTGIIYSKMDRTQFSNYILAFSIKSTLFTQGEFSTKISISVIPSSCPSWNSLQIESKKLNGEEIYACHFNLSLVLPFIIIAIVILCLISSIIICISGYKLFGMRNKIKILRKKEQAEEELTQKLLELQTLYTSELESKYSLKNWLIKIEDIKVLKKIGEGGMGVVYLALWNNVEVALKSIKLKDDDIDSNEFEHESSMLSSIRHPNIVNFYGVCLSENSKFMVTEYMSGGSLESLIYECKLKRKHINLKDKISILIGIANGMSYLHGGKDSCIIHRDLKPGNILLSNDLVPKVCDFGLSRLSNDNSNSTKTCQIGTLLYMATEILLGKYYNETVDVYSFAIIMWQLIFDEINLFHHDYATNSKFVSIMSKEEQDTFASFEHQSSLLLVPKLVSEGLRLPMPTLPINGQSQIIRLWIREFFIAEDFKYGRNNSEDPFDRYLNGLNSLFSILNLCWSQDIHQRPSFSDISQELLAIQEQFDNSQSSKKL